MDITILRRTAAEIAAAAIYELYPNVELLGGGETSTGFYCDFFCPHSIHLPFIEEKMRQIVREKRPIRTLEMLAFSAAELLRSEGHFQRAEALAEEEGLVDLIQIESFHGLSPGPHLKNTAELSAFKISMKSTSEKKARLTGWCHTSKEELKRFLKKIDAYIDPLKLGEQRGFWRGSVWLPPGLEARRWLIHFLRKEWFADAWEISGPLGADRVALHRSMGHAKVAESWISPSQETEMQISFFGKREEEVISFLQLIGKTLTILGFDHVTVSRGWETDYIVEDGIGRSHPVVRVKRISEMGGDFYFTLTVEKILFLLLEKLEFGLISACGSERDKT